MPFRKLYDRRKGIGVSAAGLFLLAAYSAAAQNRTPDFARTLTNSLNLQGRIMWVDATANIERLKTREGVNDIVAHCKKARFTTIVLDVKPVVGQVIYASKIAPHLTRWKDKTYPVYDTLAAMIEEAHKNGIEVGASFNVFGEGHKYFNTGLAYSKPKWQSVTYIVERFLTVPDGAKLPIRAPEDPEDPSRTLITGDNTLQEPTARAGEQLAVALDGERRVAGMIDTALLDTEPLAAPEDGHLMTLKGTATDWATQHLHIGEKTRFEANGKRVPVTEAPSEKVAAFVNPLNPEVRRYEIDLMKEVVQNYAVDSIVFDRMRYANVYNDFSDLTRTTFEKWLGKPVKRFPEDILQFNTVPGEPVKRGVLFKPWLEFRARVIRDFAREVTEALRAVRPTIQFGVYVGSWFTEYYGVGVNWGSEKFPVSTGWATPNYNEAGYAEFLDWVSTGCYYPIATREEARALRKSEGGTVEAAASLSETAVANAAPVYAGLYALNYQGNPDAFARAIAAAVRHSQGVMIFDLSYIYDYKWWNILEQSFAQPATPPHRIPDLTSQIRAIEDAIRSPQEYRASGTRLPAVPYQPGGG